MSYPKDIISLEMIQNKKSVPATSDNAPLVLPAVAGLTYGIYGLNISCDNAFSYTVTQGATQIKSGQGNSTAPAEFESSSGLTTDEDNVPLTVTVLTVGNYSIDVAYKLV